ncbi:hypothetical protein ASG72_09045 [Bosea sp. Leaf344]|nr:hypothetical protein ASG72_09045 [Bosea sp. Leaf344]
MAASGAGAADLPSRKAAPVEYVRVCNTYGAGFFYIPGTQTCLRVSGRLRAEGLYLQPVKKNDDVTGLRAYGRVNVDARTATAYGTLRTFIRYDAIRQSGAYSKGGLQANETTVALDKGFVQFGPLTAGRAQSMFDFYADDLNWGTLRGSDQSTQMFAYTATFGSGVSATLSLEDGTERRNDSWQRADDFKRKADTNLQGGNRLPDLVANLNVTQGWGSAQLSGALHEITASSARAAQQVDSKYGFAVQAGLKLNLPMLAQGDVLWLQGAYAEGALSYLQAGSISAGGVKTTADDAYEAVNGSTSSLKLSKGYAITAAFQHYWTPAIRQAVFGSYLDVNTFDRFKGAATGQTDYKEFRVGSNLIWSPVSGLDIGVEVLYAKLDPKGRVADSNRGGTFTLGSDDSLSARFRVQREF